MKSLSCMSFIQSYFPVNKSEGCHNTPPFTCYWLWINHGLKSELRGLKVFKTWTLPSPLLTIILSACFAPSSGITILGSASSLSLLSSRFLKQSPAIAATSFHLMNSIPLTRISASSAMYISSALALTHMTTTTTMTITSTSRNTITATIVVDLTGSVITTLIP